MQIKLIKRIILSFAIGFAVISSIQAQAWVEGGSTCYWNSQGVKVCSSHHSSYPYDPYYYDPYYHPYHGSTTYKNVKGMKTVCHYDNYGHKHCETYCNGMLC